MINPADLTFNPGHHLYRWQTKPIPGLTGILKSTGILGEMAHSSELHQLRGTIIHEAIRLFNKGTLDFSTVSEEHRPYLSAYELWLKESGAEILHSEVMCFDPDLRFACRIDLLAELEGQVQVVELKTGPPPPATAIQTAGQACAVKESAESKSPYDIGRLGLHLREDGTYKTYPYKDARDIKIFICAMTLHNWKLNNNLI